MSRTTIVAAEQGKPIGTKSAQLLADKLGARLGESITVFDLTDSGGQRDKHDGVAILDQVREWRVERWGAINTAANGLQWRTCALRHLLVRDRVDRGKQYDLLAHLSDGLRDELRESLTRHAEVCDRVDDHPNITRNRAVFQDDRSPGIWWVVDEGLEGQTLAKVLESGPLDKDRIKAVMGDILAGLEALHRAQVIRRELSPRFIYLTGTRAVLTDFELAKLLNGRPTVSVDHWPEDPYRAPEVRETADLEPRADLY